jgi:hypothetical protein
MRIFRALRAVIFVTVAAAAASGACSSTDDKGLDSGGSGGSGASAAKGGSATIDTSGGSAGKPSGSGGSSASASGGTSTGGTSSGGTDTAGGAGGDESVPECTQIQGLGTCGGTHVAAKLRTVNMLLVIDKSGSMALEPDGFGQAKWPAMKTALATALGKVESQMNFGLVLYPYDPVTPIPFDGCTTNCCQLLPNADSVRVGIEPGVVSVPQIAQQLSQVEPGGGTPTAAALQAALDYFTQGDGAHLDGNNYVLLATDGGPNCNDQLTCPASACTTNLDGECDSGNCCSDTDAHFMCLDDANVTDKLKELRSAGISTFVVGIPGTEAYAEYLNGFADAGGVPLTGGDTDYYAVSAKAGVQGLVDVFETITTQLVHDCELPLTTTPPNKDQVNVAVDCSAVPKNDDDTVSGWGFDDPDAPTSVILHGPICEALRENGAERVDVVFGCPSIR